MRKLFFLILLCISTATFGQRYFRYKVCIDGYWGDRWNYSNFGYFPGFPETMHFGYVLRGTYDGFIVYYADDDTSKPHEYILKVKIDGLNTKIASKEKKRRIKANEWYVYSGTVEYYTSDKGPTLRECIANWPKTGRTYKHVAKATIKIQPYKKNPEVYNIWWGGYGLGISLK